MEIDMTKGSPFKLIMRFLVPVVIGNVCQQLYNTVDSIVVGRFVGHEALAAVGAMGTVMFLLIGFANGMTSGYAVVTAQRFGAHDSEGVRASVCGSVILAVATTVTIMTFSMIFMKPILRLMNTPDDVFDFSYEYIMVIMGGLAFTVLYNLTSALLRAIGNSRTPLYFLLVAAAVNIVMDLTLVIVFDMGVVGTAVATVGSQGIAGILCLVYIIRKTPELSPHREDWKNAGRCMGLQFRIGLPMALQFSITAVGTIIVQSALNLLGSITMSAFTASQKVLQLMTQPFLALGVAMATFSGQNRGKGDYVRIRKGTFIGSIVTIVYAIAAAALLMATTDVTIPLFVDESAEQMEQILSAAHVYMGICPKFFVPLGLIFVFRNVLQGMGYSVTAMMGGIIELVSRSALSVYSIRFSSFAGVCYAEVAAWISACILLLISYFVVMRRYSRGLLHKL